jgi:hypothetical protein
MIQIAAQTALYIRQRHIQRGFVECRFKNTRLKIIKCMVATFPNPEKLNIRGRKWIFMHSTAAEAGSYRKVKLPLPML